MIAGIDASLDTLRVGHDHRKCRVVEKEGNACYSVFGDLYRSADIDAKSAVSYKVTSVDACLLHGHAANFPAPIST